MSENIESVDSLPDDSAEKSGSQKVPEKLREVRDDLGRRLESVSKDVRREASRAGEYAREQYGTAKENLRTGYERARKDLDQLMVDVNTYVRDNPGRSVLIAAGLGFFVGLLLRGDRRG